MKRTHLAALLLLASPAARAQNLDAMPQTQNAYMSSHIANLALGEVVRGTAHTSGKTGINVGRPGSSTATTTSLAYSPSAALKAQTVQGYVDRLKAKNPAASQAVAANLGPGKYDYGQIYRGIVKDSGLPENDAGAALTSFMILGWMIVNNVQDGNAVTVPMARGAMAQLSPKLAANAQITAPGVPAKLGEEMKLQCVVVQGGWQAAIKENALPAYQQGIAALFKNQYGMDMSRFKLTPQGFAPKAGAAAAPPTTGAAGKAPAATASAFPAGSGVAAGANWFFRAVSGSGTAVAFEPVVLLANGDYFEIGDEPLEGLNVAAAKARRPAAWGTWRKTGSAFVLTNAKGQANSYTLGNGNWFPAYAYSGAVPLKRAYENTSGGNVGVASALFINKIKFVDGSHFQQGENMGVSAPNAAAGRRNSASGTYQFGPHTLTLTYADGRVVRKSFALGAEGAPPHPVSTLVFIGGDAYSDTE